MVEVAYAESRFKAPEIPHRYGPRTHLLDDPLAWSLLARACSRRRGSPTSGADPHPLRDAGAGRPWPPSFPGRGSTSRPGWYLPTRRRSTAASPSPGPPGPSPSGSPAPGTMPSQVVYDLMNEVLDPALVRQDHLFMSRQTNEQGEVVGATWHDAKIGRDVEDRYVLFPDPMGATGSSMVSAVEYYQTGLDGRPRQVHRHAPHRDARVPPPRAGRPPRPGRVRPPPRSRPLGARRAPHRARHPLGEERGLNERHYIVPGAGGVGEILNNAWV